MCCFWWTLALTCCRTHFRQQKRFSPQTIWGGRCDVDLSMNLDALTQFWVWTDGCFKNVSLCNPQSHCSNHFLLRARPLRSLTKRHTAHLRAGQKKFPLQLLLGPLSESNILFQETIKIMMSNPLPPNAPAPWPQWLSAETPQLIDARAALQHNPSTVDRGPGPVLPD